MSHSSKMLRRLLLPIPMRGAERKIYSCVILLMVLGLIWSLAAKSWGYLDKTGSAMIIVGIWITWRDFASNIGKYGEAKRKELLALINQYESVMPKGIINTVIHESKVAKLKYSEQELKKLTELMVKRIRITEAAILIFGTFLNGFGSVILQYIWPLSNA